MENQSKKQIFPLSAPQKIGVHTRESIAAIAKYLSSFASKDTSNSIVFHERLKEDQGVQEKIRREAEKKQNIWWRRFSRWCYRLVIGVDPVKM